MFPKPRRLAVGLALPTLAAVLLFSSVACTQLSRVPSPIPLGDASGGAAVFPFLPAAGKNTGAAILIVPDAVIAGNNLDAASLGLARWLAKQGITSFVLRTGGAANESAPAGAPADVTRALSSLRSRAAEFKIAPDRFGVAGLGRGAAIAAAAGSASAESAAPAPAGPAVSAGARPAFLALFWGAGDIANVPKDAPPTFLAGSTLGSDNLTRMIDLWSKLRAAKGSVDAHFFAKRDPAPDETVKKPSAHSWPDMFYTWIR